MLFGSDKYGDPVVRRRRMVIAQATLIGLLALVTLILVVMCLTMG